MDIDPSDDQKAVKRDYSSFENQTSEIASRKREWINEDGQVSENAHCIRFNLYKEKLKALLFEQECLTQDLKSCQKKIIRLSNQKELALDKLIKVERLSDTSDDDTETEEPRPVKRKGRRQATLQSLEDKPRRKMRSCSCEGCQSNAVARSNYCRRHAPLDPNSGTMYCIYNDPKTKKQCSQVVASTKPNKLCHHHRKKEGKF